MKITLDITVMAFETDFYGVVSNTRYPEYLERGRYALLNKAGVTVQGIWDEFGVQPVVRRVEIDYVSYARHEDNLTLHTWVASHEKTTTTIRHELRRAPDDILVMRAVQTLAYINKRDRPVRVPDSYRRAMPAEAISGA